VNGKYLLLPLAWFSMSCVQVMDVETEEGVLVVLGSSTAAGNGASQPDSSWAGRYQRDLTERYPGWRLVNLAVGGYTTYHVMPTGNKPPASRSIPDPSHNITQALKLRPKGILIQLPSNDIAGGFSLEETQANFQAMVRLADEAQVQIWIGSAQPRSDFNSDQRKALFRLRDWIAEAFAARTLDLWTALAKDDGSIQPQYDSGDGIHLNDRGHGVLFELMVDADLPGRILRPRVPDAVAVATELGSRSHLR
jgi:lysophospholipase L1-like esterase